MPLNQNLIPTLKFLRHHVHVVCSRSICVEPIFLRSNTEIWKPQQLPFYHREILLPYYSLFFPITDLTEICSKSIYIFTPLYFTQIFPASYPCLQPHSAESISPLLSIIGVPNVNELSWFPLCEFTLHCSRRQRIPLGTTP